MIGLGRTAAYARFTTSGTTTAAPTTTPTTTARAWGATCPDGVTRIGPIGGTQPPDWAVRYCPQRGGAPITWSAPCPTNTRQPGKAASGTEAAGRPPDWIARYCGGVQFRSRERPAPFTMLPGTGPQVQAAGMAPALKWTLIAGGVGIVGYVIYRMVS